MPYLKASTIAAILAGATLPLMITSQAWPQNSPRDNQVPSATAQPAMPPNERQANLVQQDQSDCTNTTVSADDPALVKGNVWVRRDDNGNTNIKVAVTMVPRTKYDFYLKCVRQLGEITTDDEGAGFADFSFPTSSVGATFAFDMYPDGAPDGNKFQSMTIKY